MDKKEKIRRKQQSMAMIDKIRRKKMLKDQLNGFYNRYDRPIKSRYTHYIAGDDYKRIKTKNGRIFHTKRNQVTHIKRG